MAPALWIVGGAREMAPGGDWPSVASEAPHTLTALPLPLEPGPFDALAQPRDRQLANLEAPLRFAVSAFTHTLVLRN